MPAHANLVSSSTLPSPRAEEMTASGRREQMEYLDSDKAGTNGAPRPRTGRNICEVCERALARTDTGMCDFCTVKQQRQDGVT